MPFTISNVHGPRVTMLMSSVSSDPISSVSHHSIIPASGRHLAFGAVFPRFCLRAPAGHAQVSAAISGRVTDPAGAAVSGAAVTAKNVETGAARSTVTDDAGRYWVPSLAVGEYEVRITKQGFQEEVRTRDSSGRWTRGQRGHGLAPRTGDRASQGERGRSQSSA